MATKKTEDLTVAIEREEAKDTMPRVEVFLPELEGGGEGGIKVDQYEHVTIANEDKETIYRVHRGERVMVPVPVFLALKERYPKL